MMLPSHLRWRDMDPSSSMVPHQSIGAFSYLCCSALLFCYLQDRSVVILLDNATAVSYLNQQGGTISCSLCTLAIRVWDFCIVNHITPAVSHMSGDRNTTASGLSQSAISPHESEGNSTSPTTTTLDIGASGYGHFCFLNEFQLPHFLLQRGCRSSLFC